MTATYDCIATTTLTTSAADVTFSSISGSYTDLILVYAIKTVSANPDISCRLNSDTGSNYSSTLLAGTGSAASSTGTSNETYARLNWYGYPSTNNNSNGIHHFLNYSNTSTYKTIMGRANNADNGTNAQVNLWRSTSAITSIKIYASTGNLDAGSTFTLYAVKAE